MNQFLQSIGEAILKDSELSSNPIFTNHYTATANSLSDNQTDVQKLSILESSFSSFNKMINNDTLTTVIGAISQKIHDIKSNDINYVVERFGSAYSIREAVDNLKCDNDVASDEKLTNALEEIAKVASGSIFQFDYLPHFQQTLKAAPQYDAVKECLKTSEKYFNDNYAKMCIVKVSDHLKKSPSPSLYKDVTNVLDSYIKESKIVVDNLDIDLGKAGHTDTTRQLVQVIREHYKNYYNSKDFGTGNKYVVVSNYIGTCVNENENTALYIAPNFYVKTNKALDFGHKLSESLYVVDAVVAMSKLPTAYNAANLFGAVQFVTESNRLICQSPNTKLELNAKNEFRINENLVRNIEDYRKINNKINEASQVKDLLYAFVSNLNTVNSTPDIKIIKHTVSNKQVAVIRESNEFIVQESNGAVIKMKPLKLVDYIKEQFSYDISDAFQIELNNKRNKLAKIDEARAEQKENIEALNIEIAKMNQFLKEGNDVLREEQVKESVAMMEAVVLKLQDELTLLNEEYNDVMTGDDEGGSEGGAVSADDDAQTTGNAEGEEGTQMNECAEALIKEMQAEGSLPLQLSDDARKAIEGLCGLGMSKENIINAIGFGLSGKAPEKKDGDKIDEGFGETVKGMFDFDVALLGLKYITPEQIAEKLKAIQDEIASDPDLDSNPDKAQRLRTKAMFFAQALSPDKLITVDNLGQVIGGLQAVTEGLFPEFINGISNVLANKKTPDAIDKNKELLAKTDQNIKQGRSLINDIKAHMAEYDAVIKANQAALELAMQAVNKNNELDNKMDTSKFGLQESVTDIGHEIIDTLTPEQLKQLEGDIAAMVQGGEAQGNAQEVLGLIKSKTGEGEAAPQQAIIEGVSSKYNDAIAKYKSMNFSESRIVDIIALSKKIIVDKLGNVNESYMDDQAIDAMNDAASEIELGKPITGDANDEFKKAIMAAYTGEGNKVGKTLAKLKEDGINIGDENQVKNMLGLIFAQNPELDVEEASENLAKLFGQGDKHEANETLAQEAQEKKTENEPEHKEGDGDDAVKPFGEESEKDDKGKEEKE